MTNVRAILKFFLGVGTSCWSLVACGPADEASTPPRDEVSYELHPWVTELGPETLGALESNDLGRGVLRFKGAPPAIAARKLGDVLVGGKSAATPRGILRAVVSVTADGGDTVVETVPVPLPLAFERLHAKLAPRSVDLAHGPANPSGTAHGPASAPQYAASAVVGNKRTFDLKVYDVDENKKTKDDQLYVHAELEGQVQFVAKLDLSWLDSAGAVEHAHECLKKVLKDPTSVLSDCVTLPDVRASFEASLSGNALLDVDGAASQPYSSDPIALNEEPWQLPELWAGPVVLTPELDFTARLSGDSASYFHARTELGFDVGVAAGVGTLSGVDAPKPKFSKSYSMPSVEVSSTGQSKASFGPRLSLLAYDTFGFSAELHAFGELSADRGKTPCWDYRLGMEVTPAIRLTIPWKKFGLQKLAKHMGWTWDFAYGALGTLPLFDAHPFESAPAAQRACQLPPESALPLGEGPSSATYQTPTFTPWSVRLGGVAATQPFVEHPGQSHAVIEKTHGGSWLISGARVGSVTQLTDSGKVAWSRAIDLGLLPDEAAIAASPKAESALALATSPFGIFVASDRLTLLSLDYDGEKRWMRRLRLPSGLPGPELRELSPVAITPIAGGDIGILYSRTTVAHPGSELLLLRASPAGALRFARRFAFPTGEASLGGVLVAVGQDLIVGGQSFTPSEERAYVLRFDAKGSQVFAKRVGACGSTRVRLEGGTLRASGDLALIGTYDVSPERTFVATLSPSGEPRGAAAFWTGSTLQDVTGAAIAELPTSGFLSVARFTPWVGNALELGAHDSQGHRTGGMGVALKAQAGDELSQLSPAGLRLTTDGGAIVVAHVTGDQALNDHGLWITKLTARTLEAPFDPVVVKPAPSAFENAPCSVETNAAEVKVEALTLEDVDA